MNSENPKGKTIDRRVLRTRAMMQDALISLILQKDYREITIKEIIEEANVGRSTFYAHYTSKDDLLLGGFKQLRSLLIEHQKQALAKRGGIEERGLSFSLAVFEHIGDHIYIYKALAGQHGGAIAEKHIRQLMTELVRDSMSAVLAGSLDERMPRELIVQHVVGSFMSVLVWWLDGGAKLQPFEINAMFHHLVMYGIKPESKQHTP